MKPRFKVNQRNPPAKSLKICDHTLTYFHKMNAAFLR